MPPKSQSQQTVLNIFKHEGPFKPTHPPKKGYNGTIAKFPPYIEDPIRVVVKK